MSKKEIEALLLQAVKKLNDLEACHVNKVQALEERIDYLDEMLSSQKNMLADSMKYIKELQSKNKKEKV